MKSQHHRRTLNSESSCLHEHRFSMENTERTDPTVEHIRSGVKAKLHAASGSQRKKGINITFHAPSRGFFFLDGVASLVLSFLV